MWDDSFLCNLFHPDCIYHTPRCAAYLPLKCIYLTWCCNAGGGFYHETTGQFVHYGDVWKVDFESKTQSQLAVGRFEGRRCHSAVVFRNRYIVIFGGYKSLGDEDILSNDLLILDTVSEMFLNVHDMNSMTPPHEGLQKPSPRRGHVAGIVGNRMLVMGGDIDGDLFSGDNCFVYSAQFFTGLDKECINEDLIDITLTGSGVYVLWTRHEIQGNLPIKLALSAYAQSGHELLIFGGTCISVQQQSFIVSSQLSSSMFVFDLNTFELSNITGNITTVGGHPTTLTPRFSAAMAVISDSFLVIQGGCAELGENISNLLVLYAPRPTEVTINSWRHRTMQCFKNTPSQSPSPRNGMTLVGYEPNSPSLVMFGGGVFPDIYHSDTWTLNLLSSPVGSVFLNPVAPKEICLTNSYFKACFEDKRHADVELVVHCDQFPNVMSALPVRIADCQQQDNTQLDSTHTIFAHKIILAANSSFFRSLFDGGWADSGCDRRCPGGNTKTNTNTNNNASTTDNKAILHQQVVLDVRKSPFLHVLEYLYTGSMDIEKIFSTQDAAVDVLQCATMLDLCDCKATCEAEFVSRYLLFGVDSHESKSVNSVLKLSYSADELMTLEQQAVYLLSVADTFHCEFLAGAALEQIRLCRNVVTADEVSTLPPPPSSHFDEGSCSIEETEEFITALYAEFFESLSPSMSARLKRALDPTSILLSPSTYS